MAFSDDRKATGVESESSEPLRGGVSWRIGDSVSVCDVEKGTHGCVWRWCGERLMRKEGRRGRVYIYIYIFIDIFLRFRGERLEKGVSHGVGVGEWVGRGARGLFERSW